MRLSVSMALQSLSEECAHLTDLEAQVEAQRGVRDALIQDALGQGVTYRNLQSVTGLSRERLSRIGSPSRRNPD